MLIPISTTEQEVNLKVGSMNATLALVGDPNITVIIQQTDGAGGYFDTVIDSTTQTLSATNTMLTVYGPAKIHIHKPAGVACGVTVYA